MSKTRIAVINPYFENPGMFQLQQKVWTNYPEEVRSEFEFLVCDDCSLRSPAKDAVLPEFKERCNFRLFRITKKVPWNWLACRNRCAHEAKAPWLFLTDIDLVLPFPSAFLLWNKVQEKGSLSEKKYYTFNRVLAPDMAAYKHHPNTYFMAKSLYWHIGGYDEEFSGNYGTDGSYRRRIDKNSEGEERLPANVVGYGRSVMPDASTTDFPRKEGRDMTKCRQIYMAHSHKIENNIRPESLTFPFEQVL